MKTLKKLALLPLLFCGLLLATVACSDNDNENGDRLLPSKMSSVWEDEYGTETWGQEFTYDNQNRITRIRFFDYWYENGESDSWEGFMELTYNADGTIATIREVWGEEESRTSTFTYSGNTVTRISVREENGSVVWRDTSQFEINNRGQLARRLWGDKSSWWEEGVFHYNANGNLIKTVWREGHGENVSWESIWNIEHSTTVRAVFRNMTTPEWFLQDYFDATLSKHGFMPIRAWREDGNWQEVFTYTVENDWVKTMTIREERINEPPVATKGMRANSGLRNESRLRQDNNRRNTPARKSNGDDDYWEHTIHFEYVNAR